MEIRRATEGDISGIDRLLSEVLEVHHQGRPDLFKTGARKYTDDQLREIIKDDERPIFVAVDSDPAEGSDAILGYAFCVFQRHPHDNILTDITTLYIDDLCVDATSRGSHVGSSLYRYVVDFAKSAGCYNVTLNVWSCNPSAVAFYEHMGLVPQKIGMEHIL
ncbi:MAG: GNAT family N-acetyltransferase [Bifidobacteriaceae bacterium]|nr:GNAT family N-acetyltransferase [Bifidobacteriaceae bacterium]